MLKCKIKLFYNITFILSAIPFTNNYGLKMTLHPYIDYRCERCGLNFIPLPSASRCPFCNTEANKVFKGFINSFLISAKYNINMYGSPKPLAWAIMAVSDTYYLIGFQLLDKLYFQSLASRLKFDELFLEDITEKGVNREKCIEQAKKIREELLNKSKEERSRALAEHIYIFLEKVCEELNRRRHDTE